MLRPARSIPSRFVSRSNIALSADALDIALEVANPGGEPAPYACGLHPGFRWPFAGGRREGARVRFESEEPAEVPVIAPGGLIGSRGSARFRCAGESWR